MACWRIEWKASARKELKGIDAGALRRIIAAVEGLATEPRPIGARKLVGAGNAYRIRVGDYRIVYSIQDAHLIIEIIRVGHRQGVYRR